LLELLARAADLRERQDVLQSPGHLFDRRDHPLAVFLRLDGFGANPQRGQRCTKIVANRAERAILLFEQLHDAFIHRIEGENGVPQIGRSGRLDDDRLVASTESLGSAGQVAERPRKP
jgi:hypothetical protein